MPYANINGAELYYETQGAGIPIVFLHPPLLTSANFRYQQAQLSTEYQVITFDIRGHGRSRPSDVPITYKLIVEDMRQLLNYLKIDSAFVAGYSTGGSIALEAMLTYPGIFIGGILISAMSEASDFVLRNRIRIAIGLSSWKPAVRLLRLGIAWGNSDSSSTFRNLLEDSKRGHKRNIHELYKYSLKYNCTDRLSDINAPVLLLFGEKDRGFKRYRKILQQNLRRSKLVLLKAEKHQLPTKAADEINEAIRQWIVQTVEDNQTKQTDDEMQNSVPEAFIAAQSATGEQSQYQER
ncbi:alpha/beta fold hydrolase [Paenibacillus harenae]|uniref:alpha/beta fold hydrolase n=1 Tax=Paenibacillus harenae TaxID=306543 RepID=UPI00279103AB|nr:alpha/beta hydrolase [Paenibacillus harenae]MDQ0060542.1 pimeloyl-ACP methyl ester carboxylesterase [Paenibacillus harenae]